MLNKIKDVLLWCGISVITFGWIVFGYWLWWPYDVLAFGTEEMRVLSPTVQAGHYISWDNPVHELTSGTTIQVGYQLEDDVIINYPVVQMVTGKQEIKGRNWLLIPPYVPPGKYRVNIFYTIRVNPLRDKTLIRRTNQFEVTD